MEITQIYNYSFGSTQVCFEETSWGGITPLLPNDTAPTLENPSKYFLHLIEACREDEQKIRSRYEKGLESLKILDFSSLGLTHLPPNILLECTSAKELDISGNGIHFLPIQLSLLPLTSLDVSGNEGVQSHLFKCEWLNDMPGLTLIANDINLTFTPENLSIKVISNQLRTTPRCKCQRLPLPFELN